MQWRTVDAWYAAGQTIFLVLYAGLFVLDPRLMLYPAHRTSAVGLAVCLAGLLLMATAFIELRSVIQIAPQPRAGGRLITSGVYARFRHPIYTAIVLLMVGLFLRKPTANVGLAGALVITFLAVKTRYEERLLAARYPAYAEYRQRTWGLIPGLR